MNSPKDMNPKTRFGMAKPGIHAIPPVALLHCGRGMEDGEGKYGLTNWREHEVSASVYYNAAFRHLAAWWDGEQAAPDSGVHHLGHVMACCAIILDAEHIGKLNDDRPGVPGPFAAAVKAMTRDMEPVTVQDFDDLTDDFDDPAIVEECSPQDMDRLREILRPYLEESSREAPPEVGPVQVRVEVSRKDLADTISDFLAGDRGHKNLAVYDQFRTHIGSYLVSSYSPQDRCRLAFYLDMRAAGHTMAAREMDEILFANGLWGRSAG